MKLYENPNAGNDLPEVCEACPPHLQRALFFKNETS